MGVVEGLVAGVHGDLVLPIEAVVPQLGHPLVEQLLRFHLRSGRNQEADKGVKAKKRGESPASPVASAQARQ